MGFHDSHLCSVLLWKGHWLHSSSQSGWFYLERSWYYRFSDELQRVRTEVTASVYRTHQPLYSLVELIVLNVGLSAGILSQRVFSMFVLEALLLTFMTTPAVLFLYPPQYRVRASATGLNFANVQEGSQRVEATERRATDEKRTRFTIVLDKLEHLPGMMSLTQLIVPPPPPYSVSDPSEGSTKSNGSYPAPDAGGLVSLDAIRLIELSDRTSAVMKSSNVAHLIATDPLLDIYCTFGALHGVPVSTSLSIVPHEDLSATVSEHAKRNDSQLVLVPWLPPHYPITAVPTQETSPTTPRLGNIPNPFDAIFPASSDRAEERDVSLSHSHFVRGLFGSAKTDVALYVDRHQPGGLPKTSQADTYKLFVPFFGGPDDRLALAFAVQLCANSKISASVIRIQKSDGGELTRAGSREKSQIAYDDRAGSPLQQNSATIASVSLFLCYVLSLDELRDD